MYHQRKGLNVWITKLWHYTMIIVKRVAMKELSQKVSGIGITKGNNSPSCFFLMLNIKNLPFTKIPTYVIIYTFPEGSDKQTKGGFHYDNFFYLLL